MYFYLLLFTFFKFYYKPFVPWSSCWIYWYVSLLFLSTKGANICGAHCMIWTHMNCSFLYCCIHIHSAAIQHANILWRFSNVHTLTNVNHIFERVHLLWAAKMCILDMMTEKDECQERPFYCLFKVIPCETLYCSLICF